MKENILKDFETFSEFPDKYLEITKNSDYYYISKPTGTYIAKRKIDLVTPIKIYNMEKIVQEESYFDVVGGSLVTETESLSNLNGSNLEFIKKGINVRIIPLISFVDEQEDVYYLSQNDIEKIVGYNSERVKKYFISLNNK